MKYYDSRGNIENIELDSSTMFGTCANIYPLQDGIYFKKYYTFTSASARMNYEIFSILQKLNHSFTNTILDVYFQECSVNKKEPFMPVHLVVDGYKFQFIEEEKVNILYAPTEYFLYNLKGHENLIHEFTDCQVKVDDLKADNTVFTKDKIMLIDLDNCRVCKDASKEMIQTWNQIRLLRLYSELFKKGDSSNTYTGRISALFQNDLYDDNVSEVISKQMVKYKRPIDFLSR